MGPPIEDGAAVPTVQGPVTGGKGAVVLGPGGFDLATVGYQQEEYFISGDATAYVADGALAERRAVDRLEGRHRAVHDPRAWCAGRSTPTTSTARCSSSGSTSRAASTPSPDWTYAHVELIRSGAAWVGVSAQQVGIVGGGNPLGRRAGAQERRPRALRRARRIRATTTRYDMYSQAGAAVWAEPGQLLGELEPERVLAIGESQSAFRLTTYVERGRARPPGSTTAT